MNARQFIIDTAAATLAIGIYGCLMAYALLGMAGWL